MKYTLQSINQKVQKLLKRDQQQCFVWFALSLALGSASCTKGPAIELCQIDGLPSRLAMDCSTERLPQGYSRTAENADGYICGSAQHIERFFIGCRDRRPVSIHLCNVDGANHMLYCAGVTNGQEVEYSLTWTQAMNYVCTNPRDLEFYLEWCYR